jgi:hypothetical protein
VRTSTLSKKKNDLNLKSVSDVNFWWTPFKDYLQISKGIEDWRTTIEAGNFQLYLSDFLFDVEGGKFQKDFRDMIYHNF